MYATVSQASFAFSLKLLGMAKSMTVVSGINTSDILSHGMNFLPLLNFTLSNSTPKIASLTASHTLTASMIPAVLTSPPIESMR